MSTVGFLIAATVVLLAVFVPVFLAVREACKK